MALHIIINTFNIQIELTWKNSLDTIVVSHNTLGILILVFMMELILIYFKIVHFPELLAEMGSHTNMVSWLINK